MSRAMSILGQLALCAFALLAAAACSQESASAGVGTYGSIAKKPKPGPNHYFAVRAKKDGAGVTERPDRELWKPFRAEATIGMFDPAHADLGETGEFGVSMLQGPAGLGGFYILTVSRSGDDLVLDVGTGGEPVNSLTLTGTLVADVVFESTGGIILVSARKPGDADYTPAGALVAGAAGPYRLSFDASDLPKGTIVGMSRLRVTENGSPPAPTDVQTAREAIYVAADALAEAAYALDGTTPDRTEAVTQLTLAETRLDAALALDMDPAARRKVSSVRRKNHGLIGKVPSKLTQNKAIVSIAKVVVLAAKASSRLD